MGVLPRHNERKWDHGMYDVDVRAWQVQTRIRTPLCQPKSYFA
jgi:hypothetical protein